MSGVLREAVATDDAEVPVRLAATVILLRDSPSGPQVWLMTRVRGMAFASGMTVFPGGRADRGDSDLPWAGPSPSALAHTLGCDENQARILVGAAARETFEEAGLLLTRPSAQLDVAELRDVQSAVETGRLAFGEALSERGLAVDAALFRPWGRWITPAGEVRRYDTHFFVAALPSGARAEALTTEAFSASWVPVADAIAGAARGARKLLPPTRAMLGSLEPFASVADVFAAASARDMAPVRPIRIVDGDELRIELSDGTIIGRFRRQS